MKLCELALMIQEILGLIFVPKANILNEVFGACVYSLSFMLGEY
jgi:hypothetical protein